MREPQFVLESLDDLGVGRDLRFQDLDREHFAGLPVARLVDDPHSATAELP
jgi:hypothetical protein